MTCFLQSKVQSYIQHHLNKPGYACLLFTRTYYQALSLVNPSYEGTNEETESVTNKEVRCSDQKRILPTSGKTSTVNEKRGYSRNYKSSDSNVERISPSTQESDSSITQDPASFQELRASTNQAPSSSINHISPFKRLVFYIHYCLFTLVAFSTILNLLLVTSSDYKVFYLQYFISFYCFMIYIDYNVYLFTYKERKQLLDDIAQLFIKSEKISRQCLTTEVWFSLVSSALLGTSYVMFMVQPFLIDTVSPEEMAVYNRTNPTRRYSAEFLTGFDYSVSPYYEIGFVIVMYTGICLQIITFDTVTTLPLFALHIKGQLDIISSYLRTIGNDSVTIVDIRQGSFTPIHCSHSAPCQLLHSASTKHLLKQLIQHHQLITHIIARFSRIHQPVFGLRIFLSTTLLLGILCQYAFTNNTHILFVATNMVTILQFNFFFNSSSELLHSGYANVKAALIGNNWYRSVLLCYHSNSAVVGCHGNESERTMCCYHTKRAEGGCHSNESEGTMCCHHTKRAEGGCHGNETECTMCCYHNKLAEGGCHGNVSDSALCSCHSNNTEAGCHSNESERTMACYHEKRAEVGCHGNVSERTKCCYHSNRAKESCHGKMSDSAFCCCHSNNTEANKEIAQMLSIMLNIVNHKTDQYVTFCHFHKISFVSFVRCVKFAYSIFVILFKISQDQV